MLSQELLLNLAAGAYMLTGVGHTAAELLGAERPLPPALQDVMNGMKATAVTLPGRQVPLFDLMRGMSLMMGALLIAVGAGQFALVGAVMTTPSALVINLFLSAVGLLVSARYLFPVPTILMGLATLSYAGALWMG